jgi:hypothetical protein
MTLIVDNKSALKGRPGLHALIAGVSYYRHLPDGETGMLATETFGLNQLSAAATSAYKISEWLKERADYLPERLATVRLLLSPAADESDLHGLTNACTRENFGVEAHQWRADASTHNDNVTFFYYAGHGLIRMKSDSVLLMEDFGQPGSGPLERAVAFDDLFYGMAPPTQAREQRARRQFYFIDACREFPETLKDFSKVNISDLFFNELHGVDDRTAPVFHSAVPGQQAYTAIGEQTLFGMALLNCLKGVGGEAMAEDDDGRVRWHVSVSSLNEALQDYQLPALKKYYQTDQDYTPGGFMKNTTIHYLDGPPQVEGILKVVPSAALPFIAVDVLDSEDKSVFGQLSLVNPHLYQGSLTAGSYVVRATVLDPPQPPYVTREHRRLVEPPSFVLRARPLDDSR